LFGAVVPYPFARTKAITHQLIDPGADRPEGWSSAYAEMVRDVVLPGYTAFSVGDARTAAACLLSSGPVRIKEPPAAGGAGHTVATTIGQVEALLESLPDAAITTHGLVIESNLRDVTTLSIGQITIADITIAYHGTQRVAINNAGAGFTGAPLSFACAGAGSRWCGCRCPARSASLPLRPNSTRMPCVSIRALWFRAGTTTLLRGSTAKAGDDQAFWKRRGARAVPARLSSRR